MLAPQGQSGRVFQILTPGDPKGALVLSSPS